MLRRKWPRRTTAPQLDHGADVDVGAVGSTRLLPAELEPGVWRGVVVDPILLGGNDRLGASIGLAGEDFCVVVAEDPGNLRGGGRAGSCGTVGQRVDSDAPGTVKLASNKRVFAPFIQEMYELKRGACRACPTAWELFSFVSTTNRLHPKLPFVKRSKILSCSVKQATSPEPVLTCLFAPSLPLNQPPRPSSPALSRRSPAGRRRKSPLAQRL